MFRQIVKILILTAVVFITDINIANAANVNFTLGIWTKPASSIASKAVLVKNNELRLVTDANGKVACQIHNGTAWQTAAVSASALSLNAWQYLSYSYDGSYIRVFIDGKQDGSQSMAENVQNTTNPLYAGRDGGGTYGYFQGIVDDVRVYNYARTQDEILVDYNAGKAAHLGKDSQRDDGLVGFWNMEEGTGQTVFDRSGNGNNGTLGANSSVGKDDPVFTSGYSSAGPGGTALKFDGVDDYVDAGNGASLNITNSLTISSWFKIVNIGTGIMNTLVDKAGATGNRRQYGFIIGDDVNSDWDEFVFTYHDGTWRSFRTTNANIASNVWHQGTVVINNTTPLTADFYLDGKLLSDTAYSPANSLPSTNWGVKIGTIWNSGVPGLIFNGTIDEVRIYNRALSADEIRQHYNQKKPILEMKFDEGSGQKAYDESFNNNDGWLGGTSAVEATDPTWTTGKFGNALSFDGTNDWVNAGNGASLKIVNAITMEAWVKIDTFPTTTSSTWKSILNKEKGFSIAETRQYSIGLYNQSNVQYLQVQFASNGTTNASIASNSDITGINTTGTWYHIAGTWDGTTNANGMKVYVNGILKAQGTSAIASGTDKGYNFAIGRSSVANGSDYHYFNGLIDSVRIYNYARTPAEILVDYNNGLAGHLR